MSVVRGFSCTVEKMRKFVSGESWRVNIIGNFGYNLAAGDTDPCTAPATQITILASSYPPRPPGPCPSHGELFNFGKTRNLSEHSTACNS